MADDLLSDVDTFSGPTFTLSNRLKRLAWNVVAALLFRPSPIPFHAWRAFLLRLFGATLGAGVHVYPRARIWAPWNLEMGDQASMANDVTCYSMATIRIGKRAIVSQGAHLCAGTHDYHDPGFRLVSRPISIGEDAWVCAEAFVHPGVTVGAGAVVGARSVVTKDMPEWTVCAGHPCAPIKPRVLRSVRASS